MIAVVDVCAGNLRSVEKALEHVGASATITAGRPACAASRPTSIAAIASGMILMGNANPSG